MPDLEAAIVAVARRLAWPRVVHHPALDGVDAMRHPRRGKVGGLRIVYRDIDPEVVAALARIVERAVERVREVQRGWDGPAVIDVGVVEPESVGQGSRRDEPRGAHAAAGRGRRGVEQARGRVARDPRRDGRQQREDRRHGG